MVVPACSALGVGGFSVETDGAAGSVVVRPVRLGLLDSVGAKALLAGVEHR